MDMLKRDGNRRRLEEARRWAGVAWRFDQSDYVSQLYQRLKSLEAGIRKPHPVVRYEVANSDCATDQPGLGRSIAAAALGSTWQDWWRVMIDANAEDSRFCHYPLLASQKKDRGTSGHCHGPFV